MTRPARNPFGAKAGALFREGIRLFNRGQFWEAHETFEDVWRGQEGDAKKLAQGFVQAAAALSYIEKRRYRSVLYLFDKSVEKLSATSQLLPRVNIPQLIDAIKIGKAEIERLGEAGLDRFDSSLYPRIVVAPLRSKQSKHK